MPKIKIDMQLAYGDNHLFIEAINYNKFQELMSFVEIYKQTYASGVGYVYTKPEKDLVVDYQFVPDESFEGAKEASMLVTELSKSLDKKQSEVWDLQKQLKEKEDTIKALSGVISPAHLLTSEEIDKGML